MDPVSSTYLRCTEEAAAVCDSTMLPISGRRSSDGSARTIVAMPLQPLEGNKSWTMEQQVYIGSSHCPIDGWYQACRFASSSLS